MSRHLLTAIALLTAFSAGGCDARPEAKVTTRTQAPAPAQATPLTANGTAETLAAEAEGENIQWAASVVRVDDIPDTDAKMFGVAGGDPAMNGLLSYIAFWASHADGWLVFKLGDFLDYTILSTSAGRVDLDIQESTYDDASGNIGSRHRKVIVTWTPGPDGELPTTVSVTPAA